MTAKSQEANPEPIARFWQWFSAHSKQLEDMIDRSDATGLSKMLSPQLDKIIPRLAWEVGPGKAKPCMLTISSEGDTQLRGEIQKIVELAPNAPRWEFYASRQPRPIQTEIELVKEGIKLSTKAWLFAAKENLDAKKLDIRVVDKQLASIDLNEALKAVFIFLDSALGEDSVEEWIGKIEITASPAGLSPLYEMAEISEYVRGVAQRYRKLLNRADF